MEGAPEEPLDLAKVFVKIPGLIPDAAVYNYVTPLTSINFLDILTLNTSAVMILVYQATLAAPIPTMTRHHRGRKKRT